jgi:hypothetical protein
MSPKATRHPPSGSLRQRILPRKSTAVPVPVSGPLTQRLAPLHCVIAAAVEHGVPSVLGQARLLNSRPAQAHAAERARA